MSAAFLRPAAEVVEIRRGRFVWGATVPWLPDLLNGNDAASLTGNTLREAFGRQIAFLRAVVTGAPTGSAIQLRFVGEPATGHITCQLIGAADSAADAGMLDHVVRTALPAEFPLQPVTADGVTAAVAVIDTDRLTPARVVEIRRTVDRLDPTLDSVEHDEPVLFPWVWSPQALISSLGLLRVQSAPTTLVVHLEPTVLPGEVAMYLQDEIRRMMEDLRSGEENPLALAVLQNYRRWLRLLPKGCASMRLLVGSDEDLAPGMAESLSTDLTRSFEAGSGSWFGAAAVLRPQTTTELDACAVLLDELVSREWRQPAHPELAKLASLFDPLEANTAFRLPVTPRGGLPGVATQRLPTLAQGRSADSATTGEQIVLGSLAGGGELTLTMQDLNRHVLVAGLPGFGKTRTVQLMLRQAYLDHGVPFLVLDPAKSDYRALLGDLAGLGCDVAVHRLTPTAVGFNPFAVPPGVEPISYAGRVLAALENGLHFGSQFVAGPLLLARAVYRMYDESAESGREPTLRDLYRTVAEVLRTAGYPSSTREELSAALLGRLELLATGALGLTLSGGSTSGPNWESLTGRPTVIELGGFAAPGDRSLIFGLLTAGLLSYAEVRPAGPLRHLTVLEEAHRVLRAPRGDDPGVDAFVDAIAELRGAGEGFVVVDQAPTGLHPAVMKLTGTKIVHRIVDSDERAAVGAGMVLDPHQLDDVARLAPRRAIAYTSSASEAAIVDIAEASWSDGSADLATVKTSLAAAAAYEPVHCIGCRVACTGSAGLAAFEELAELLGPLPANGSADRRLVAQAWKLTRRHPETSCLATAYAASQPGLTTSVRRTRTARVRDLHEALIRQHQPDPTDETATGS